MSTSTSAQRRPEREPRRHLRRAMCIRHAKAAQRRPEREPRRHYSSSTSKAWANDAQRRPEREPRRHTTGCGGSLARCRRSTKAGARTPATLHRPLLTHVPAYRSTKAGARTPATRLASCARTCGVRSTGRSANPGDTFVHPQPRRILQRSTKAGARTPATPGAGRRTHRAHSALNEGRSANPGDPSLAAAARCGSLNEGRSANPGDTEHVDQAAAVATLLAERGTPLWRVQFQRMPRSTKAGARTPATRRHPASPTSTLNEGRSRTPATRSSGFRARPSLNEGRSANPGDTARLPWVRSAHEGRTRTPATGCAATVRHQRSTKAGARTPATRNGAERQGDLRQRRPEPNPGDTLISQARES